MGSMVNIMLIGEDGDSTKRMNSIILEHFKYAQTQTVKPRRAIQVLPMSDLRLIVYVVPLKKQVDLTLVNAIKSVNGKAPLLIYEHLTSLQSDMIGLLDSGVKGLLSIDAPKQAHLQAIDALTCGNSYVDRAVKFQALANLFQA